MSPTDMVQSSLRAAKKAAKSASEIRDPVDAVRNEELVIYPAPYSSR